jgi:hypothetical protein
LVLEVAHDFVELSYELGDHSVGDSVDLEAVLERIEECLGLLDLDILVLDEGLLLGHVLLNFFEEEVDGLALVLLDPGELLEEALDVLGRSDLDEVLLALVEQELELPLGVFARFDLLGVGQIVGRLVLVQVDKVAEADVTELVHDVPGVILGHSELVESHQLGSTPTVTRRLLTCRNPSSIIN